MKYVQYMIDSVGVNSTGVGRKEVIQAISEIGQKVYYVPSENYLDYPVWDGQLPKMKRLINMIKSQAITSERSHICVSQQYHWYMMS